MPLDFEEWKPIPDWEGFYEVSNLARVRTTGKSIGQRHGQILKQRPDRYGYLTVRLHRNAKLAERGVHTLVAGAFIGPRPKGLVINHKDGLKSNNHPSNLEYITNAENIRHAYRVTGRIGKHYENRSAAKQEIGII